MKSMTENDDFLFEYFELIDKYNRALMPNDDGGLQIVEMNDDEINELIDDWSVDFGLMLYGGFDED